MDKFKLLRQKFDNRNSKNDNPPTTKEEKPLKKQDKPPVPAEKPTTKPPPQPEKTPTKQQKEATKTDKSPPTKPLTKPPTKPDQPLSQAGKPLNKQEKEPYKTEKPSPFKQLAPTPETKPQEIKSHKKVTIGTKTWQTSAAAEKTDQRPALKSVLKSKPASKEKENKAPVDANGTVLSEDKLQEIRETFTVFDKNRDGMITKEELGAVLFALGQRPTSRELQALIRSVDVDNSGSIDFDEFVKIFSHKMSLDPEKELYEVFCIFDKDKDGFISENELYEVLQKLGENITKREAGNMVKEADLNGDGKVDYDEFKAILTGQGH